ncbi:MAG: hypothetical protein AB7F29_13765 [Candidatus Nitrosocosmicus sp.]
MNIEQVKEMLNEIDRALEQSAANHNALLGRKQQCLVMLDLMEKKELELNQGNAE